MPYHHLKTIPARLISHLEKADVPVVNYIITFLAIILLRHIAESFSQVGNYFNLPYQVFLVDIIHFALCYITLAMLIIGMFHYVTDTSIANACKVVLPGFLLLLLAPLLDLLLTQGHGVNIMYFVPGLVPNLAVAYLTIGANYPGISWGMRIEIIIAIMGFFAYFRVKQLNILSSMIYAWLTYTLIFLVAASPYFLLWFINLFGFQGALSSVLMVHFYMIVSLILGPILFYAHDKTLFLSLLSQLSWQRWLHYELLMLLGGAIGWVVLPKTAIMNSSYVQYIIINMVLSVLSLFFLFLAWAPLKTFVASRFATSEKVDKKQDEQINQAKLLSCLFLVLSGFYAFIADTKVLFMMALLAGNCCLYFLLPLRLQRMLIVSKLLLALNAIVLLLSGYIVATQGTFGFPKVLFLIFLTGYCIAANLIDLKSEKNESVGMTLAAVIGEKHTKVVIGLAAMTLFSGFFYLTHSYRFLIVALLFGIIQFVLINRRNYQEALALGFANLCTLLYTGYCLSYYLLT